MFFRVIDCDAHHREDEDCGLYETFEQALACVEFDRLERFEIWAEEYDAAGFETVNQLVAKR